MSNEADNMSVSNVSVSESSDDVFKNDVAQFSVSVASFVKSTVSRFCTLDEHTKVTRTLCVVNTIAVILIMVELMVRDWL